MRTRGSKRSKGIRLSDDARAAYREVQRGVGQLAKSVTEIQRDARKAERKIEAEARQRIRELRKEARLQVQRLQSKRREASHLLKNFAAAAGDSWREIKQSADAMIADARTTAASVIDRFRRTLGA